MTLEQIERLVTKVYECLKSYSSEEIAKKNFNCWFYNLNPGVIADLNAKGENIKGYCQQYVCGNPGELSEPCCWLFVMPKNKCASKKLFKNIVSYARPYTFVRFLNKFNQDGTSITPCQISIRMTAEPLHVVDMWQHIESLEDLLCEGTLPIQRPLSKGVWFCGEGPNHELPNIYLWQLVSDAVKTASEKFTSKSAIELCAVENLKKYLDFEKPYLFVGSDPFEKYIDKLQVVGENALTLARLINRHLFNSKAWVFGKDGYADLKFKGSHVISITPYKTIICYAPSFTKRLCKLLRKYEIHAEQLGQNPELILMKNLIK